MAETVKSKNRRMRQELLREQLSAQGHVQHVVDITNKLSELDAPLEQLDVQRLKAAADIKLKLIDKYLPSLKQTDVELTGEDGKPIETSNTVNFIPVGNE